MCAELLILLCPGLDDPLDRWPRKVSETEVVARWIADDSTSAVLAVPSRDQGGEVIREHVCSVVVRVPLASGPFVAGAEVTRGVVLRKSLRRRLVDVALPRALGPLGGNEDPLAREGVVAAVGVSRRLHCRHRPSPCGWPEKISSVIDA